jgi:hypothetical protein
LTFPLLKEALVQKQIKLLTYTTNLEKHGVLEKNCKQI